MLSWKTLAYCDCAFMHVIGIPIWHLGMSRSHQDMRVRRRRRTKGNNKDNVTRTFDLHSCLPCNRTLSTILLHGSQLVWFASSQKLGLINLFVKHILQTHKTQKYAIHIHKVKHPNHQWYLILSLLKYMSKVHTVMYVGCESSLPLWCIHRIVRGYGKDTLMIRTHLPFIIIFEWTWLHQNRVLH